MVAIDRIMERLVKDEDEVLHAYPDHLGFLTIGVGRMIDVRKGGGISQEESRYLLGNDVRRWLSIAMGQWDWFEKLDWPRQGVLVCMLFQLGASGTLGFRKMLAAIERGDYKVAADEMIDSHWHGQTPERCERMASVMRTGEWL